MRFQVFRSTLDLTGWIEVHIMPTPVRARRLNQDEGQDLLRLVRRGVHDSVRYRRALIIPASSA